MPRTSLVIRYSQEDSATLHDRAAQERRTISGYLLYVLERSLLIEEKFRPVAAPAFIDESYRKTNGQRERATKSTLLRCTVEEATRIRKGAVKRQMSISHFVLFSLHRHWRAQDRLAQSLKISGLRPL